jgi:hypothetical protein
MALPAGLILRLDPSAQRDRLNGIFAPRGNACMDAPRPAERETYFIEMATQLAYEPAI